MDLVGNGCIVRDYGCVRDWGYLSHALVENVMLIVTVAALVMLAGVLMYALCTNPKLADIGRIMFACGLLAILLQGQLLLKIVG